MHLFFEKSLCTHILKRVDTCILLNFEEGNKLLETGLDKRNEAETQFDLLLQ